MEDKDKIVDEPNLAIFNKLRKVPQSALKQIGAGRLKGMSDINPVWRNMVMTSTFGVCGFGWKYEITKQWTETFGNEIKGFCNINLYIKVDDKWSDPIPGTGGSSFVSMERNGAYVNDEVYKMALTDALSVSMKAIGVAADVYFSKGADLGTKYALNEQSANGTLPVDEIGQYLADAIANIKVATSIEELTKIFNQCVVLQGHEDFMSALSRRKKELRP